MHQKRPRFRSGATLALIKPLLTSLLLVAAACGGSTGNARSSTGDVPLEDWDAVLSEADGQTVQIWMWGGDPALNAYIADEVAPRVADYGVTLKQVRLDATEDGISRIVSELEAGEDDGVVDLLWVNGKNFAQGKDAGLWAGDWVSLLPNAVLLAPNDPTLFSDFGVPTDGQEAPWSRAAFSFAHDHEELEDPPRTFADLARWVEEHPGRFTYPAPPDFTGSAFVRQAVQALGEDAAFELLVAMAPHLWNEGRSYPRDEAELNQLFANGEVSLAMSYNPNFVQVNVEQGSFPETARPFIFDGGTLQNVSFLAMPKNAGSRAGAMVVMNELLEPELQALKLQMVGAPAVVDIGDGVASSDYRLTEFGTPLEELPADQVPTIDERWIENVLS